MLVAGDLEVKVYPQATKGEFNIVVSSKNPSTVSMEVFDGLGRLVMKNKNIVNRSVYNFGGNFTAGVYYLKVMQGDGIKDIKLIKL